MEFFNDRRPSPGREGDDARSLDRMALRDANTRIRAAAPEYRMPGVNLKIRTTAVRRYRARRAGLGDFGTVGEYISSVTGSTR